MKRLWIGFIVAAVVLTGGFFFLKKSKNSEIDELTESQPGIVTMKLGESKGGSNTEISPPAPQGDSEKSEDKKNKYEEKLRSEGYVDNPKDPYTLMKKVKKPDGREVTYLMPKDEGEANYVEPQERDKKTAEEILESKKDLNPAEEISSLKRLDDNDEKTMMLLGKFRDEAKDLEIFFGPVTDEKGNPLLEDVTCLVSPKYNLNFKRGYKGQVRTDDTGYAILKLSEQVYARVAWSFNDRGRLLHGQVYSVELGQSKLITNFEAKGSGSKKLDLKYCD